MKDYVDGVTKDMQDQIDSKAEQYFYAYDPTLDNEPANNWTTDEEKENMWMTCFIIQRQAKHTILRKAVTVSTNGNWCKTKI